MTMISDIIDLVSEIKDWELENTQIINARDLCWAASIRNTDTFVIAHGYDTLVFKNSDVRILEHWLQTIPT